MSFRVRHVRLRALTSRGMFGADIPMSDGLMVIRAENSRGKSTAVQSILFALGLERMITARPTSAVTSAMRDRLIYDAATKAETPVLASWVTVEVHGENDRVATVTRWVKDDERDPGLVRVAHGPIQDIDSPQTLVEDYYVGRAGAAANPSGFHNWLAGFIGWEMPELPARDGRTAPLYLEQVFPLLFVEQRRGWGGIQAQMPYFAGVSDVKKKAIEFILNLDIGKHGLERERLRNEQAELAITWKSARASYSLSVSGLGLSLVGVPEAISLTWPPQDIAPYLAEPLEGQDEQWRTLDEAIDAQRKSIEELEATPVGATSPDHEAISARIVQGLDETRRLRGVDAALREEMLRDETELRAIAQRLESLTEDLRQHRDVATLERLGSSVVHALDDDCPVCHQALPDSLLGTDVSVMTPTESVAYIGQQIQLFESMRVDAQRTVAAKRERWVAVRNQADEVAREIRSLRETLLSPQDIPSVADVAERVRAQERLDQLVRIREQFYEFASQMQRYSEEAADVRARLRELPTDALSTEDRSKLQLLQAHMIEQLHQYEFGSFLDEELTVSTQDYLPRRDEFDVQADISASDSIRVIWAYLLGLLEVGELRTTHHPGFLVFDEPKQQSAKDVSFAALLQRASLNSDQRQVVFATSEELDHLQSLLSDLGHSLHVVDGYLLQQVSSSHTGA